MSVSGSARRHGVPDADIEHAIKYALVEFGRDDDTPHRWLVLGPNSAGMMLELVVLVFDDGVEAVIHAMPMRARYQELLPGGEE